jgi:hypothetical protein
VEKYKKLGCLVVVCAPDIAVCWHVTSSKVVRMVKEQAGMHGMHVRPTGA